MKHVEYIRFVVFIRLRVGKMCMETPWFFERYDNFLKIMEDVTMEKNNENIDVQYSPLDNPESGINFLIREKMMLKAKGKTDSREYQDLCKIIQDNLKSYKK